MEAQRTKEGILRESIVLAAQRLFQHHGLRKVTMDDVARAIGKGKSSLYYYFKNKEEIFEAVVEREMSGAIAELRQAIEKEPTASAQLEAFVLTKLRAMRQRLALYALLQRDIYQYYSLDFAAKLRKRYQAGEAAVVKDIVTFGVARQEFKELSEADIARVAAVVNSSLYGFEQELLAEDCLPALEPEIRLLIQLLTMGLKG